MEKKSLLNNLRSAKKANVIKAGTKNEGSTTRKAVAKKAAMVRRPKMVTGPGGPGH